MREGETWRSLWTSLSSFFFFPDGKKPFLPFIKQRRFPFLSFQKHRTSHSPLLKEISFSKLEYSIRSNQKNKGAPLLKVSLGISENIVLMSNQSHQALSFLGNRIILNITLPSIWKLFTILR